MFLRRNSGRSGRRPVAAALQPPRRDDSANISHLRGPVMNNINVPFAGPAEPARAPPSPAEPARAPPSLPSSTPCATLHAQPQGWCVVSPGRQRSAAGPLWGSSLDSRERDASP
ncbi:hypothetical protein PYW08_015093 [Mythimna loreyi]|uniref:Uncharacterized protein n=1 Tax=Mythimna loreyi TaxID=667449 RepID=A0ACC2R4Q4_9NEOP|nr:hypothetical protein PYW08_015093 [Mythimna loreyi]